MNTAPPSVSTLSELAVRAKRAAGARLRVAMMPDYRARNPYQSLLADALEESGTDVFFPKGYRRGLPVWRALSGQRVDVLHLHWLSPYLKGENALVNAIYAAKFGLDLCLVRLRGVKIVWTIHNQISHEALFPRTERFVQSFVSRLASRLIIHSESALRSIVEGGLKLNPAKVSVIPHGNYTNAYPAPIPSLAARSALGLRADQRIFLYFGIVRPYKNLEGLIAAWRSLPELAAGATLLIAGEAMDPVYRRQIAALAEGLPGLRLQLRRIPDSDVHLYFSAADVVVLPFDRILTSGSLLLAMSFGKPVIAPRLDTINEALRGADDLVYESRTAGGIQRSLQLAASPQVDLANLSRRMQQLCANLNWDRIASMTSAAYRE